MGSFDMQVPWSNAHLLSEACLHGETLHIEPTGTKCEIHINGGQVSFSVKVIGRLKRPKGQKRK